MRYPAGGSAIDMRGALLAIGCVVGGAAMFVLTTVLMHEVPDGLLVAAGVVGVLAVATVMPPGRTVDAVPSPTKSASRRDVAFSAAAGILMLWAAPLLALSQRASDAPPGTEVLFFQWACWGAIGVWLAWSPRREYFPLLRAAAALASLAGTAALLGSLERPSSFSPFARFPQQTAVFLAAGVLFAVGMRLHLRGVELHGARRAGSLAVTAAAIVAVAYALSASVASFDAVSRYLPALVLMGVAAALFALPLFAVLNRGDMARGSVALLLVPSAITLLSALERTVGMHGPDPIRWTSAFAGISVAVAGGLAVWLGAELQREDDVQGMRVSSAWRWVVASVSATVLAFAVYSLTTPAIRGYVESSMADRFRAGWLLPGYETASGVIVFCGALLAVVSIHEARRGRTVRSLAAAGTALVCAVAQFFTADTPLRTWNWWIPIDVQQTYGTEFTLLAFQPVFNPLRAGLLALLVLLSLASLLVVVRRELSGDRRKDRAS